MLRKVLAIFIFLIPFALAQFSPPVYITNPDTGECRYYFAGDAAHFNPRPENFTVTIGPVNAFSDVLEACTVYHCISSGGGFGVSKECICPNRGIFVNNTGCVGGKEANPIVSDSPSFDFGRIVLAISLIVNGFLLYFLLKRRKTYHQH
ncbi:hypothetical protein J4430_02765 [Candidatus Woesearchaeota archaeon]|nr:hypothetical protein [Candidatus Woesearchaeota archaeon]